MRNLNKTKKLTILLIFTLLTMSVVTVVQAQDEDPFTDQEIPEWLKDIPAFGGFFAGLGLLMCFAFLLILLIIAILLCIWIYKDAERRGKQGVLWLLLLLLATIFLNIIGLIIVIVIWLAIRPPIGGEKKEPDRRCPNCGRSIPMDAKTCPYCAKKFEE